MCVSSSSNRRSSNNNSRCVDWSGEGVGVHRKEPPSAFHGKMA